MSSLGEFCFEIELIEDYPCNNRTELELREGFYIESLKACLNMLNPAKAEFYADIMKTRINESIKCECGGSFIHGHQNRHFLTNKHNDFIKSKHI